MSTIWLGTISERYGPSLFWVAGNEKSTVKECVAEELESDWGEEQPIEWVVGVNGSESRGYEYYEGRPTAEVREIIWLD